MTKSDLLSLLKNEVSVEELAVRRGVTEAEVVAARDAFLVGVESRRFPSALVAIIVAVVVSVVATRAAAAGTCAQTLPAPLATMCPNEPATANDVNNNFDQVVRWVEEKTGPVGDGGIVTNALRVNGAITGTGALTTTGATTVGSLTVNGNLRVNGSALGAYSGAAGGTDIVAATDGFVVASLVGDSNGARGHMQGFVNGTVRARSSTHFFSTSDVYVNEASFTMPVQRGATWRVNKTDTSGTCTVTLTWVPLNP